MDNNFIWTDKLVAEFARISAGGQYEKYKGAKTIKDKLKILKMAKTKTNKSHLLSLNSASITLDTVAKNKSIFSAKFHVEKLKGKDPYILRDGKYIPAIGREITKAEYLTPTQVTHINNLKYAITKIEEEIENIKLNDNYQCDMLVSETKLSNRAKNVCENITKKDDCMLSEIAKVPLKDWARVRGMGELMKKEIIAMLESNGFKVI